MKGKRKEKQKVMSNKLKKRSAGYDKVVEKIKAKLKEDGGLNVTGELMRECIGEENFVNKLKGGLKDEKDEGKKNGAGKKSGKSEKENVKEGKGTDPKSKSSGSCDGKNDEYCSEDEFYTILSNLSDEGYNLYKIIKISNGDQQQGLMICEPDTIVVFVKEEQLKKRTIDISKDVSVELVKKEEVQDGEEKEEK